VLSKGDKPSHQKNQNGKSPTCENKATGYYDEEPSNEGGRLIAPRAHRLRSNDHHQPDDQVDNRNAGTESRNATHDIMKNGQEL